MSTISQSRARAPPKTAITAASRGTKIPGTGPLGALPSKPPEPRPAVAPAAAEELLAPGTSSHSWQSELQSFSEQLLGLLDDTGTIAEADGDVLVDTDVDDVVVEVEADDPLGAAELVEGEPEPEPDGDGDEPCDMGMEDDVAEGADVPMPGGVPFVAEAEEEEEEGGGPEW